jgi:uncharacterized protein (DUF2267 family)
MAFDSRAYRNSTVKRQPKRKPKAINLEAYAAEGNHFFNEVAFELGIDRDSAARITRAVFHALRDRLNPIDAVQFGQGLPIALKGIYFDQYPISKTPVRIRSKEKFLDFIYEKAGNTASYDFPDRPSIIRGLQAVFFILERTMSFGQVEQVKNMLNIDLQHLVDEGTVNGFFYYG